MFILPRFSQGPESGEISDMQSADCPPSNQCSLWSKHIETWSKWGAFPKGSCTSCTACWQLGIQAQTRPPMPRSPMAGRQPPQKQIDALDALRIQRGGTSLPSHHLIPPMFTNPSHFSYWLSHIQLVPLITKISWNARLKKHFYKLYNTVFAILWAWYGTSNFFLPWHSAPHFDSHKRRMP